MPIVVQLHHQTFTDPAAQTRLAALSAVHELVLVGAHDVMPEGRVSHLRRILAPRRMVALLLDDDLPGIERALIGELLNDGVIPVVVTPHPPAPGLLSWLDTVCRDPAPRVPRQAAVPHGLYAQ